MRLKSITILLMTVMLLSCGAKEIGEKEDLTLMRLYASEGKMHPHFKASEYLAKLIERRSDGKMRMQVKTTSPEGRAEGLLEQLSFGGITMTLTEGETLLAMIPELKDLIGTEDGISYESVLKKRNEINDVLKAYGIMMLTCYHPKARAIFARSEDWEPSQNTKLASVGEISHQGHSHISSSSYIELSDAAGLLADYTFDAIEAPIVDFASSEAYAFAKSVSIFEEPPLPVFLLMTRRIFSNLSASEKEVVLESAELSRYYADSLLKRAEETILIRLGKEKRLLEEN